MDTLITGATGFVGSHLVEHLAARGETARALVRETSDVTRLEEHGFPTVAGGLDDQASLRRAVDGVDTVYHLAAATRALDPDTFRKVNAEGTARLVAALSEAGRGQRLVYLSSLAAVGPSQGRPVRPGDVPRPLTAYGRSKLAGEEVVRASGLKGAVLRAPAVYGPRERDMLPFFRFARFGLLPVVGPSDRRLQLIHISDLAAALVAAAETPTAKGIYHVAEPRAYTWGEVLDRMAEAVGRSGVRVPVPGAVVRLAAAVSEGVSRLTRRPVIFDRDKAKELLAEWTCETDAARRALGFEARISLNEGLRETAEWYRAYGWL